jgi:hypothetical protein
MTTAVTVLVVVVRGLVETRAPRPSATREVIAAVAVAAAVETLFLLVLAVNRTVTCTCRSNIEAVLSGCVLPPQRSAHNESCHDSPRAFPLL